MVATTTIPPGAESAKEEQQQLQKQRVYVGGIDPSRGLQVNDVVTRIQNRLPVSTLDDIHLGSTYSQFTVDDLATYETIHKMFHNVTWKGCKLTIEVARPHLLERLRLERRVGKEEHTSEASSAATASKDEANHLLRRHWKVKRRFGEPFFAVDTKPFTAESWETFSRAAKRKRTNAAAALGKRDKYSSRHNRSILLRFDHVEVADKAEGKSTEKAGAKALSQSSKTDESSGGLAGSEESRGSKYAWSDENSSSDDCSSATAPDEDVQPAAGACSESESSMVHGERTEPEQARLGEPSKGNASRNDHSEESKSNSYIWSDDDDDSSSDDASSGTEPNENMQPSDGASSESESSVAHNENKEATKLPWKADAHSAMANEFESAVDFDELELDEAVTTNDSLPSQEEMASPEDPNIVDLSQDVDRNMSLLAQLFGSTTAAQEQDKPVADTATTATPTQSQSDDVVKQKRKPTVAAPKMMRFDPTDLNATENYLADSDSEEEAPGNEEEKTNGGPSWFSQEAASSDPVYEQGKLEQVFKASRESITEQAGDSQANAGVFSFGFEVAETDAATTQPLQAVADNKAGGDASQSKGQTIFGTSADTTNGTPTELSAAAPERNRRPSALSLFDVPSDDMIKGMVRNYFYDGEYGRIMNNLDGWRRDPAVKEQWLKQRHTLTLDWRNKRKAALERKKRKGPMTKNNKK